MDTQSNGGYALTRCNVPGCEHTFEGDWGGGDLNSCRRLQLER
jgi:hypothetical protein